MMASSILRVLGLHVKNNTKTKMPPASLDRARMDNWIGTTVTSRKPERKNSRKPDKHQRLVQLLVYTIRLAEYEAISNVLLNHLKKYNTF